MEEKVERGPEESEAFNGEKKIKQNNKQKCLLLFCVLLRKQLCPLPPGGKDVGCDHISVHMSTGTHRHVIAHQRWGR